MIKTQTQRELATRMNKGIILWYERKADECVSHYESLQAEFESVTDPLLLANYHNLIGNAWKLKAEASNDLNYLQITLSEYQTAKDYLNKIDDLPAVAIIDNNIADVKLMLGLIGEAHSHLNVAEEILSDFHDSSLLGQALETRARVYLAEGKIKEAEKAINRSEKLLMKGIEAGPLSETLKTKKIIESKR